MKKIIIILIVLMMLVLCSCNRSGSNDTNQDYPRIAYIDDVLYYGTDKICEMVPRKMPDGFIETFVGEEIMPDSYNSANFGSNQGKLEYMFLEDGKLIIHVGDNWVYFENQ